MPHSSDAFLRHALVQPQHGLVLSSRKGLILHDARDSTAKPTTFYKHYGYCKLNGLKGGSERGQSGQNAQTKVSKTRPNLQSVVRSLLLSLVSVVG